MIDGQPLLKVYFDSGKAEISPEFAERAKALVGARAARDLADLGPAPDLVVDGIVGIGGRPGLRPEAVAALEARKG